MGFHVHLAVIADASAALGIIERKGFREVRRLEAIHLWIQETVATKQVKFPKVKGQENPSDLMIREAPAPAVDKHIVRLRSAHLRSTRAKGPNSLCGKDVASASEVTNWGCNPACMCPGTCMSR